jgi:5,6-dimethylbenzimidazole synthase
LFDAAFQARFGQLLAWRRDVRRFRSDTVPEELLASLLELTRLAPSVGNCQPTRWARVDDSSRRAAIAANFEAANRAALATYDGERAQTYARLKLEGLREAPVHLAVFCDEETPQGHGLGARTMPQTRRYSAICALHTFWLAARMHGLGVGWVSILDPSDIPAILDIPPDWSFIAYLCVGWPREEHLTPELEREGWQARTALEVVRR